MYVRSVLSLRNVEDLLNERGIDIKYEKVGRIGLAKLFRHRSYNCSYFN